MKYEVVKYRPEFKSQVVNLQAGLWGPDVAVNTAYLEWKYHRNPYLDEPSIYLALCRGQVVGMRGIFGVEWQIGNPPQTLCSVCAGDLVIAPEHRNRGLFTEIMDVALNDLADKGYVYVFNLSATLATHLGSLMTGWRSVGVLETASWKAMERGNSSPLVKDRSRLPSLSAAYRRVQEGARKLGVISVAGKSHPFSSLDRNSIRRSRKPSTYVSVEQTPRPDMMAELVERIGSDGRIRHVRDQQYFAWRFQNPLSVYRFLFWQDIKLEGYLVLGTSAFNRNGVGVSIVDWEATNAKVRADLLHAAINWGNFDELTIWSETLSDEAKMLLQNAGFKISDETPSVGRAYREGTCRPTVKVRSVHDEMMKSEWVLANRSLLDVANWDLRMIYSDSF